jgi:hypothetical protein
VLKFFDEAHALIPHSAQWPIFAPSFLQPVQLIISGVMSGELYITLHFSAVCRLSSSSFASVAILASQEAQLRPQQEISFSIF